MNKHIFDLSTRLGAVLRENSSTVTTAESCTGGGVASAITAISGSSEWFHSGYVTYANHAKIRTLGVSEKTLENNGAVSEAVVIEMAHGAAKAANADFSIAISGVAGPAGGTVEKPVGTVWFAWLGPQGIRSEQRNFSGDRNAIREQSVEISIQELLHHVMECTTVHPYSY